MSIPDLVSKVKKIIAARVMDCPSFGEGPSVPAPPATLRHRPTRGWEKDGLERYSPPTVGSTPVSDPLFRAGTPIEAYYSVGSNLAPTPTTIPSPLPTPMATPLPLINGASGSMVHIKEDPSVSKGRRRTPDSPTIVKRVRKQATQPKDHGIATARSYKGQQQFTLIHPSVKVLAITSSHIILGHTDELWALADKVDNEIMATLLDKANQVGKYLQRSGVMDEERLYLKTPLELLTAGYHFMEVVNIAGLWAQWKVFKGDQPRLVLLTWLLDNPVDGFEIHH
jgi:hypothetical protein